VVVDVKPRSLLGKSDVACTFAWTRRLVEARGWRRPSVYVLAVLAAIYQAGVLDLLDLADHEGLPQQDRLVLLRQPRAGLVTFDGEPGPAGGSPDGQPPQAWASAGEGVSLTLPFVPGRLVIEVSGPPGAAGPSPGRRDDHGVTAGRLVLLQDEPPSAGRGEVAVR
jgi:hypothetical protein